MEHLLEGKAIAKGVGKRSLCCYRCCWLLRWCNKVRGNNNLTFRFRKKRHEENRSEHRNSNGEKRYWRKKENIIYTADIAIVNILDFLPAQQKQKDTHTFIHCWRCKLNRILTQNARTHTYTVYRLLVKATGTRNRKEATTFWYSTYTSKHIHTDTLHTLSVCVGVDKYLRVCE